MPKAKPTQVIVHRIELQQSERDMLELAVAGNVATNAVSAAGAFFSGVGNMLAPFAPAFGALAALWIGDKTLDVIRSDAEQRKEEIEQEYASNKSVYDSIIAAGVSSKFAEGGWEAVCSRESRIELVRGQYNPFGSAETMTGLGRPIPNWYLTQLLRFLDTVCNNLGNVGNQTPSELWVQWMSEEEYGQSAYYEDTNGSTWEAFKKGIGTLFD